MTKRRMIYFRDTGMIECWQIVAGYWTNLQDRYAFDFLHADDYDYYAFDTRPEGWLGDRKNNPMPYIQG